MPKGDGLKKYKIIPDANLSKILGDKALTIPEMLKALWTYIKKNDLKRLSDDTA